MTSGFDEGYSAALFLSVSHVMKAEKILLKEGIPHKIIPVPRELSSDCGVCIRFEAEREYAIRKALEGNVEIREIVRL